VIYERVRRRVSVERLSSPWTWTTPKGDPLTADAGDFRISDPRNGGQWSITPNALSAGYRQVGPGVFESHGTVRAREVRAGESEVIVGTAEGAERAVPGDWVVTDANGNQWVVDSDYFDENYAPRRELTDP